MSHPEKPLVAKCLDTKKENNRLEYTRYKNAYAINSRGLIGVPAAANFCAR